MDAQARQRLDDLNGLVDLGRAEDAVKVLDQETPPELRRVLRAHWEVAIRNVEELKTRDNLDEELSRLELLEIAAETGYLNEEDVVGQVSKAMRRLLETGPVQRFIDNYYYFGTRFLSCRIKRVARKNKETDLPEELAKANPKQNIRMMSLPCPPDVGDHGRAMEIFIAKQKELKDDADVKAALDYLDDFVTEKLEAEQEMSFCELGEQRGYLLWLRGLYPVVDAEKLRRFESYTRGLKKWIQSREDFYKSLDEVLQARFGILSFYYIARLLRAEVSPQGIVTYGDRSWIDDLEDHEPDGAVEELKALRDAKHMLRHILSSACDIIQESVWIAGTPEERDQTAERSREWRFAFDDELDEIAKQRAERLFLSKEPGPAEDPVTKAPALGKEEDCFEGADWSRRASEPAKATHLTGVAFSGGGIRSATFNLGVLEGLRELDILRKIDYLSTVSGGGYIGAWLAANVKRAPFWLSRGVSWAESIAHLRKYSNYLSPQVGVLSADTWTMIGIWMRNTALIQLTVFATILCLLIGVHAGKLLFDWWPENGAGWVPALLFVVAIAGIGFNLAGTLPEAFRRFRFGQAGTQGWIVMPVWAVSFLAASAMWNWAKSTTFSGSYFAVMRQAWDQWSVYLVLSLFSLMLLALITYKTGGWLGRILAGLIPIASTAMMFLVLCAIMQLFNGWQLENGGLNASANSWKAYVWGPPLVLTTFTATIVLFLGLLSRQSEEWTREWWTRLGAWFGIYGTGFLLFGTVTFYGPKLIAWLTAMAPAKFSAGAAWAATTLAGLVAGGGSQTKGDDAKASLKAMALNAVAKVAALAFIGGVLVTLSALLKQFLDSAAGEAQKNMILGSLLAMCVLTLLFAWRFDINIFSLNSFYRNRLVRCYLGATRWAPNKRKPQPFTGFDEEDDLRLKDLRVDGKDGAYRGPFPIVNCALNLGGSSDLSLHTRHSAAFALTPLYCGNDRRKVGYVPTWGDNFIYAGESGNPYLGQAIAISGAAANPNMGYHTSPLVAFLLTLFNVRLGWWLPNPGQESSNQAPTFFSLRYLLAELFGMAGESNRFVNLSDGGHFENLGVYELVRRRCRVVIASDSECDDHLGFGGLGNLIRICEVDFGAKIKILVDSIRKDPETGWSRSHGAIGRIEYSNGSFGYLIYLKASMTGDEDPAVQQYKSEHMDFPHETTGDQFFTEDQFESYRRMGKHVVERVFRDVGSKPDLHEAAKTLDNLWTPAVNPVSRFIDHTSGIEQFWKRFQGKRELNALLDELFENRPSPPAIMPLPADEFAACVALIQLMENAYMDLRLDDHWEHPDNRGWQMRFLSWAKSGRFRAVWKQTRGNHGLRFRHFCESKLGLE